MKKPFNQTAVGKLLKSKGAKAVGSFVKGALGVYIKPLAGAVAGVVQVREDNLSSEEGGKGKINWSHLIGLVASLTLLALHLTGKLTEEKMQWALDLLSNII
tara:strand:- start:155 stop:460 length:306 start_codon:yes stop_codon:yes gene_type:complete